MAKFHINNTEIIFEGCLKKSPPLKSKSIFNLITKRWRRRYFVLFKTLLRPVETKLYYFKSKPHEECKSIGNINLGEMQSMEVNVDYKVNRPNTFSIQTYDEKGHQRIFYLSAESSDIMNLWAHKIAEALNLDTPNSCVRLNSNIQSPINRGLPKTPQVTLSKSNQISRSVKSLDFICFTPVNTMSNINETAENSYYNLESKLSPNSDDLEEPMCIVDDVYKLPNDQNSQHAYVNLDEEITTPIEKSSQNYFNKDSIIESNTKSKNYFFDSPDYKFPIESHESFNKGDTEQTNDKHEWEDSSNAQSDFDFPLPTRVRSSSVSSSSSGSSDSSSINSDSNSGATLNNFTADSKITVPCLLDSSNAIPPQVPKRLVISPIGFSSLSDPINLLPIKPSKSVALTILDSSDIGISSLFTPSCITSALTSESDICQHKEPLLNYIENGCLELHTDMPFSTVVNPSLPTNLSLQSTATPSYVTSGVLGMSGISSSNTMGNIGNNSHPLARRGSNEPGSESDGGGVCSTYSFLNKTSCSDLTKESLTASVEYKEILISRTEAIHKLKYRIQNE